MVVGLALLAALTLGGAGGYAIGAASAPVTAQVTTASGAQIGPASRWTHEERVPAIASRWDHEERP
jgi:hypothetical protein